ncbi:MAG: hypothetical protein FJY34_01550 [Betaproteobacteria bacterium]|nr:hypothetical protein [Betaproteobacteria bacterium]
MRAAPPAILLLLVAGIAHADGIDVANGGRCHRLDLPDGRFAVTYHHSMYDQPVREEFVVRDGAIELRRLESPSAAVLEYFGVTAPGPTHARSRRLGEIVMRVATGEPQVLQLGATARSLREFGRPGDRIVIRAATGARCHA